MLMGSLAYAPVKYMVEKIMRRRPKVPQTPSDVLLPLSLEQKSALLTALVTDLAPHNVDRLYHNAVRTLTNQEEREMPGDVVETSAGPCVVIDLAGNMVGPFCTQAVVSLVQTCVLNPHLVAPGTNSDFVDLRIRRNDRNPHPFTVYNGVQSLFEVDDAPLAVWARDYVALSLAKIAHGFDAWPDDLVAASRDYLNNGSQLRSRGMVAFPSQGGSYVWTGVRWMGLPLGPHWVSLYRAACADPAILASEVTFSRSSNGMVAAEFDGEVLSRCSDTPEGVRILNEAVAEVGRIVAEVRANGGIEGAAPSPAHEMPLETVAHLPRTSDTLHLARPALVMSLMAAVDPSQFAPDRENSVFAVADYIHGLERRLQALEEAGKPVLAPPPADNEGQSADPGRRRAIRS